MAANRKLLVSFAIVALLVAAGVVGAIVYRAAIPPIAKPAASSFPKQLIERGAALAAIGDCDVCHTAPNGQPYAGGRPIATPFGTLYSDNITPDGTSGIGTWSNAAFKRAMRDGISRSGRHLYPALPYEHFTQVNDDDLDALYAFLMTRRPVMAKAPENHLIPPLGFRPLLAFWNLLYLHHGTFVPDPGKSDEWNRGAYLVRGLGHCGSCHTPRNIAGGEESSHAFAGGTAEGWIAPALDTSNPAARTWTADALYTYLRTGVHENHSAAAGPMGPVTHGLAAAPATDVRAIAVYVASLMNGMPGIVQGDSLHDKEAAAASEHPAGAALFNGACSACHGAGAPMMAQGRPALSDVSALQESDPRDTIQVILRGLRQPTGAQGPYMPPFADSLTDAQIVEITAYLRSRYSEHAAWPELASAVTAARKEGTEP